jgi:hypothetical protein
MPRKRVRPKPRTGYDELSEYQLYNLITGFYLDTVPFATDE